MKFTELGLTDELLSGLNDINFTKLTSIQEKAIPHILEGKDTIGIAQTGTGKTGAFVIPILNRILNSDREGIKAVIVTPTRELAQQIDEQIFAIGYHAGISSATIIGGSDFSAQAKALKAGVDLIVATPGRLIDQNKIVNIDFSTVEFLVLDEADRMLDMGFLPDMKLIIGWMPEDRQTLLFSATMPKEIEKLAGSIMNDPVSVEVAPSKPAESVEQRAFFLKSDQKIPLVKQIFKTIEWDSCIIFTSTKKGTDELQRLLKKEGIKAASIHGDRSQEERNKALAAFKNGEVPVIVATNVLARGIDIKGVSIIINYDVPRNSDDYIHRIGRTGRYDQTGIAVTFVTKRDRRNFGDIEKIKGNKIRKITLPGNFDESSRFDWEKPEEVKSGKKSGRGEKKERKDSGEEGAHKGSGKADSRKSSGKDDSRKQRGEQEKKGKSQQSKSKDTRKDESAGKEQKKEAKRQSGSKQSSKKRDEKQKSRGEQTNDKPSRGSDKKSSRKSNGSAGRKDGDHSSGPDHGKKEPEIVLPVVEKAAERNRYARKPAKGYWGLIKSLIPKFRSN